MRSFAILMLLSIVACGDDASPTGPSTSLSPSTTGPLPEAMVTITWKKRDVGWVSYFERRFYVQYALRIEETAGVGITLKTAQMEFSNSHGSRVANDRVTVDEYIAANSHRRIEIRWEFVEGNKEFHAIRTTYRFVDDNGHTKELQLDNATEVSGLKTVWSRLPRRGR